MSTVSWALWVRGLVRTRIEVADGGEDALADLTVQTNRRQSGGYTIDRDGTRCDVERTAATVAVLRDHAEWFRADGDEAVLGGDRLTWDRSGDATRRATIERADGSALVRVRPGVGRGAPFAIVDVDPRAPGVLPVVLGVSFVLLASDAIYNGYRNGPGSV